VVADDVTVSSEISSRITTRLMLDNDPPSLLVDSMAWDSGPRLRRRVPRPPPPPGPRPGRQLLDQARLADPGLARDQHQAPVPAHHLVDGGLHSIELVVTADQG